MILNSPLPADPVVRLLGAISVFPAGDAPVEVGPLAANLLLSLALATGRSQSTAALIADIWGDDSGPDKRPALQTQISRLRALAGPGLIVTRPGGYVLKGSTDLEFVVQQLHEARTALKDEDYQSASKHCDTALGRWRGRTGAGAPNQELVDELAAAADDLRDGLREVRAIAAVELGRAEEVLADVRHLSVQAPYDDTVAKLLLRTLHLSGRTNEALEAFAEYRSRLADELGSRPTADLDAYHLALLIENADPAAESLGAPEAQSPQARSSRRPMRIGLRSAPNPLLGREQDLRRLSMRLAESRLVTISGPGGIGKTRLASEIAQQASASGIDVAVIELAGLRPDADIAVAITTVLGAHVPKGVIPVVSGQFEDRLIEMLDDRPTLLVIDNCEHVLDSAARWISEMLAQTTQLRVLATSRAALGIAAERVYLVDALPAVDSAGLPGPAVDLFIARAHAARQDVTIGHEAVVRLCEQLDGLPLAIELAASRTRVMSVEEILNRLSDRFALLRSGDRTAPGRHQTLAAVIDWSWELLTTDQRDLLCRAGVFPDGFSAEAAAALVGGRDNLAIVDDLEAIVSQSLLRVEDAGNGRSRFRMLETVREFALLRLTDAGEGDNAEVAFLDWVRQFAQRQALAMDGTQQELAFAGAGLEMDTVVGAMHLAVRRNDPRTIVACYSMIGTWWSVRHAFGELVADSGLIMDACGDYDPAPEDAQFAVAAFALTELMLLRVGTMRDVARARICLRRSFNRATSINPTYRVLGEVALYMADQDEMMAVARRTLESAGAKESAISHLLLALILENAGEMDESAAMALRARELAKGIDHLWMRAMAAQTISGLYSQTNHPIAAVRWAREAYEDYLRLGPEGPTGEIEQLLAFGHLASADYVEARTGFEALRALGERGAPELVFIADIGLAEVSRMSGEASKALASYRELSSRTALREDATMRPWHMIVDSGTIAVHVLEGEVDHPEIAPLEQNLAREFLDGGPPPRNAVDFPLLGTVLVGIAAWETHLGNPSGGELLALAERFSSRQDFPALVRAEHFLVLEEACSNRPHLGLPSPATAREMVAGMDYAQCLTRANELLEVIAGRADQTWPVTGLPATGSPYTLRM